MTEERSYLLKEIGSGQFISVDTLTGISITWERGKFNETQEVACPDSFVNKMTSPVQLAHIVRLMADWIVANHRDLL